MAKKKLIEVAMPLEAIIEEMDIEHYDVCLEERRKLMVQKIKKYFFDM